MGVEEFVELGAEGLLFWPPGEPHYRAKGGTPVSTPANSCSRTDSMESIVQGLSDVALLTECQPWASCTMPPMMMNTWPDTPLERSDASHATKDATFSGAQVSNPAFSSSAAPTLPMRNSVMRVRARGAMALDRTPKRSSSRPRMMAMAAMPALAAP